MATTARIDELKKKFDENPRRYFAPLANELRKAGDLEQAIALCRAHLPQQSGHISGHIILAQALFEANELDEARHVFEQALDLDPENLIALRSLGDIARAAGDMDATRAWYDRVLEVDPRNEEILDLIRDLPQASAAVPGTSSESYAPSGTIIPEPIMPMSVADVDATAHAPAPEHFDPPDLSDLLPQTAAEASTIGEWAEPANIPWTPNLHEAETSEWASATSGTTEIDFGLDHAPTDDAPQQVPASYGELEDLPELDSFAPTPASATFDAFAARFEDGELEAVADPLLDEWLDEAAATPPVKSSVLDLDAAPSSLASEDDLLAAFEDFALEDATSREEPTAAVSFDEPSPTPMATDDAAEVPSWLSGSTIELGEPEQAAPALAASDTEVPVSGAVEPDHTPRFTPAVQDATPAAFVTETMAELYLQQGFREEALGIYRQLLAQNPSDPSLRQRVAQLEAGADSSLDLRVAVAPAAPEPEPEPEFEAEAYAPEPEVAAPVAARSPSVRVFFGAIARRSVGSHRSPESSSIVPDDDRTIAAAQAEMMTDDDDADDAPPSNEDIQQFTDWLEGLNKP